MQKLVKIIKFYSYEQSLLPYCNNLELPALLIKPIQKLPQYELQLKEIIKYTDNTHKDYHNLKDALKSVETINQQINTQMKDFECTLPSLFLVLLFVCV